MGVGDKIRIDEALAVIAERLMVVPLDETAASGLQNGLCGARVPMHGGGDSRIDVRRAVGDVRGLRSLNIRPLRKNVHS